MHGVYLMSVKAKVDENPDAKAVVTLPGTVEKIIPAVAPAMGYGQPEKAQIAVEGAEPLYREIRVENTLQNEAGEVVHLKEGAEVEVTIQAKPEATIPGKETEKEAQEPEEAQKKLGRQPTQGEQKNP